MVGTFYAHILSMEETDTGARAIVCQGNYSLMTEVPDGTYSNHGWRIPSPFVIDLSSPSEEDPEQVRITEGPARAPQEDMFGDWTITRHAFSTGSFDDNLACAPKFPDPPETRPQRNNEMFTAPYPTLPPYPGWPDPTH